MDCNSPEVSSFKKKLETHFHVSRASPPESETESPATFRFLDDEKDLVSLHSPTTSSLVYASPSIGPLSLIPLIIPLLLFKIFTSGINRILIVGLTLALSLFMLRNESIAKWAGSIDGRHGHDQQALIVCTGISMLVGLLS